MGPGANPQVHFHRGISIRVPRGNHKTSDCGYLEPPNFGATTSPNFGADVASVIEVVGTNRRESAVILTRKSAPEDCGCAPTDAEKARLFQPVSRRSAIGIGAVSLAAVGIGAGVGIAPAFAASYPSWDDVQRAKNNEAAKAGEVTRIQGLINSLTDNVNRTRAEAERLAEVFFVAQEQFFDAAQRSEDLQAQADQEAATALTAANKAGKVAAQLYRNGGDDTAMELFFAGSAAGADDLLSRLGSMDKLVQRNGKVYAAAVSARNAAQALTDQAVVARDERDRLKVLAEDSMFQAQEAAQAAQAALDQQTEHLGNLQAQLAALKDTTTKTVQGYQDGVEAARKAKEEADRRAREQAERDKAAAEAAGGGGGGGGAGNPAPSGWARPSGGAHTSGYGQRYSQCGPSYCASGFHRGVDMAAGCGAGIYAASAGTVTMAWDYSGFGNYVRIEHGGGIATSYGHMSKIFVRAGQQVSAGQTIGAEGRTGNSFGCHVHFEVYVNGAAVDPQPFMRQRGISV